MLEALLAEETQHPALQLLIGLAELENGPFLLHPDGTIAGSIATGTPMSSPPAEVVAALRRGVVQAQRLVTRQLQLYRDRIDDASMHLRRVGAEVPDGIPTLLQSDTYDPDRGVTDLGQMKLDHLALNATVLLHRALRRADLVLEATSDMEWPGPTTNMQGTTAPEAGRRVPNEPSTASVGQASRPSNETRQRSPAGDRNDQVVDLRSLAGHAAALTEDLERAWSDALNEALLSKAQEELNARYATLLHTLQRRAAAGDHALTQAGSDPGLPADPLPLSELAKVTFDAVPEQRHLQLRLAEIEALKQLLNAIRTMREPSTRRVYFDQQPPESWWEAGSFVLVRDRVGLLVRVSEQLARIETEVAGGSTRVGRQSHCIDRLRQAALALRHSDVEAALVHTWFALRSRVLLDYDTVPANVLGHLADDPRLVKKAPILRLFDGATTRIASGEEIDIDVAVLVAPHALSVITYLCLDAPDILSAAVEKALKR
jgi:hypothetical protein